jgi:hypothetical protein
MNRVIHNFSKQSICLQSNKFMENHIGMLKIQAVRNSLFTNAICYLSQPELLSTSICGRGISSHKVLLDLQQCMHNTIY